MIAEVQNRLSNNFTECSRGATRWLFRGGAKWVGCGWITEWSEANEAGVGWGAEPHCIIYIFFEFALKVVVFYSKKFQFYLNELSFAISLETN